MARTVSIGRQDFQRIRESNNFYVDKTHFIREWWEADDEVTLIARPRRFGKTLNMSMLEKFFSASYAGRGDLFEGLSIWEDVKYRGLQGTWPVISLSFADIKETSFIQARKKMCRIMNELYKQFDFLLKTDLLTESEKKEFWISADMEDNQLSFSLKLLSSHLSRYYGKKVLIFLDEYDTPMQEAFANGYWDEMAAFIRSMFNSTFKTNPYMARAVLTGITRISKESIFSDLNNLKVVTVTSEEYADAFGFTEREVFQALDEFGLSDKKEDIKQWYDGFTFGNHTDIYNPWSILSFIKKAGKYDTYWSNTSGNGLVNQLIQKGNAEIKQTMEDLLQGKSFEAEIDEKIVFDQLNGSANAVWSLLLATGYLKVLHVRTLEEDEEIGEEGDVWYTLTITNLEVRRMFRGMVKGWFGGNSEMAYSNFIKALLMNDVDGMNEFMNRIALHSFSSFDIAKNASDDDAPERFYHGFVLGLMVELAGRFEITSNRESGFGRYDVVLKPKANGASAASSTPDAIIMEFKVHDPEEEKSLEDTVRAALAQIEERAYDTQLTAGGIPKSRIRHYGFAFQGKKVLIG